MPRDTTRGRKSKKTEEGTLRVTPVKPLPAPDPDGDRPVRQPQPSTSAWMWEYPQSPPPPAPLQPPPTPEPGDPRPEAKLYELLDAEIGGLEAIQVWKAVLEMVQSLAEGDAQAAKGCLLRAFEEWRAEAEQTKESPEHRPESLTKDRESPHPAGVAKQEGKKQSPGQGQSEQESAGRESSEKAYDELKIPPLPTRFPVSLLGLQQELAGRLPNVALSSLDAVDEELKKLQKPMVDLAQDWVRKYALNDSLPIPERERLVIRLAGWAGRYGFQFVIDAKFPGIPEKYLKALLPYDGMVVNLSFVKATGDFRCREPRRNGVTPWTRDAFPPLRVEAKIG